jgi:exportin-T
MDAVTVIDQNLVTGPVHALAMNTLTEYRNSTPVKWNDAELALYLVYSYGEMNKSRSHHFYRKFCAHRVYRW